MLVRAGRGDEARGRGGGGVMTEFFIVANSFAAPIVSDQSTGFISAENPAEALTKFFHSYKHPCGLYSAVCYANADDYHKGNPRLAIWKSNHAIKQEEATKDLGSYSYFGNGPGIFQVNGKEFKVKNPKHGKVITP